MDKSPLHDAVLRQAAAQQSKPQPGPLTRTANALREGQTRHLISALRKIDEEASSAASHWKRIRDEPDMIQAARLAEDLASAAGTLEDAIGNAKTSIKKIYAQLKGIVTDPDLDKAVSNALKELG